MQGRGERLPERKRLRLRVEGEWGRGGCAEKQPDAQPAEQRNRKLAVTVESLSSGLEKAEPSTLCFVSVFLASKHKNILETLKV